MPCFLARNVPSMLARVGCHRSRCVWVLALAVCERPHSHAKLGVEAVQVDGGELIWGQDRFTTVEDMLCGWSSPTAPSSGAVRSRL